MWCTIIGASGGSRTHGMRFCRPHGNRYLGCIVRTKKVPGFPRPYLHHAQCCSASYAGACRRVPVRRQEHIALGAGTPGRTRTFNLPVNSRLLYRLSYRGIRNKKARGLFITGRSLVPADQQNTPTKDIATTHNANCIYWDSASHCMTNTASAHAQLTF